jgi:LacI family repressor for deo operon, udp, cdd, tsx, nupC, and nupG
MFSANIRGMPKSEYKKKNPTVQDVARAANVSTATVSRVLTTPDRVSAETRRRVSEAVEKTGYVLNHAARNLRRRDTGTIVALVPDIGNSHFSNILQGIETVCAERQLKVLIADTRKPSMSHSSLSDYFSKNNCDGIVILDGHFSISRIRSSNPKSPPIVLAGEWSDDPAVPIAVVDNLMGADLAVSHLLELKHSNIGHVTGLLSHKPGRDRLDGFQATLGGAGHDPANAWIFEGDYTLEAGVRAAKAWLDLPNRPSAVFCASDRSAFGFISFLSEAGIRVPQDVSVVGFDDIDIAGHFVPPLTTIHQPRRAVGEQAAKLLLNLLGGAKPDNGSVQLEPWLVVRKSAVELV